MSTVTLEFNKSILNLMAHYPKMPNMMGYLDFLKKNSDYDKQTIRFLSNANLQQELSQFNKSEFKFHVRFGTDVRKTNGDHWITSNSNDILKSKTIFCWHDHNNSDFSVKMTNWIFFHRMFHFIETVDTSYGQSPYELYAFGELLAVMRLCNIPTELILNTKFFRIPIEYHANDLDFTSDVFVKWLRKQSALDTVENILIKLDHLKDIEHFNPKFNALEQGRKDQGFGYFDNHYRENFYYGVDINGNKIKNGLNFYHRNREILEKLIDLQMQLFLNAKLLEHSLVVSGPVKDKLFLKYRSPANPVGLKHCIMTIVKNLTGTVLDSRPNYDLKKHKIYFTTNHESILSDDFQNRKIRLIDQKNKMQFIEQTMMKFVNASKPTFFNKPSSRMQLGEEQDIIDQHYLYCVGLRLEIIALYLTLLENYKETYRGRYDKFFSQIKRDIVKKSINA